MANMVMNGIGLLLILVVVMGMGIGLTILNPMEALTVSAVNNVQPGAADYYHNMFLENKAFFISNLTFLIYLMALLMFYTSVATENTIKSYGSMTMAGMLITGIVCVIGAQLWNGIGANALLDFSDLSEAMWFVSNFQTIAVINLLIGLCAFIFIPKAPKVTA